MGSDKSELAIVYASLILASGGLDVTAERLESVVKSANVEVESYWYSLFARALEGKDVNELVSNAGAAAPSSGGAAAAGGAADGATAPCCRGEEGRVGRRIIGRDGSWNVRLNVELPNHLK